MQYVQIGDVKVSRFILGGNPFSGFSHLGVDMDMEVMRYYTTERIKRTIKEAESLSVNTFIGRVDNHILRILLEYRDEGGTIQLFGQTCPELGDPLISIDRAKENGAKGCHIHGGVMDNLLAQGRIDGVHALVEEIHKRGMLAGIAGHNPKVFEWAEESNLDADYYMCSYYDPTPRDEHAGHVSELEEHFLPEDRERMTGIIPNLSKPVIHYKILASGRHEPADAFSYAAKIMRATDAVCVGVYTKDKPDMIKEDIQLLLEAVAG
ncbi:hypothetical protein ACFL40_04915 [candidate division KSB1 bacterium]